MKHLEKLRSERLSLSAMCCGEAADLDALEEGVLER